MNRAFALYMSGYVVIIVACTALFFSGQDVAAQAVGWGGTVLYQVLVLAWVAIFDSRRKWPNVGVFTRLGNVLSFQRADV